MDPSMMLLVLLFFPERIAGEQGSSRKETPTCLSCREMFLELLAEVAKVYMCMVRGLESWQ